MGTPIVTFTFSIISLPHMGVDSTPHRLPQAKLLPLAHLSSPLRTPNARSFIPSPEACINLRERPED